MLFTLPFIVLSLGIGVWVINALLLYFVGKLVEGFSVQSFWAAMLGALVVSVTTLALTRVLQSAATPPRPPAGGPPPARRKDDDVIDI